jgi:hypothetical protein
MRIAAFAVLMLVLTACAPGVYGVEWNTPSERAPRERVIERVIEVEVPVVVEVPVPAPPPEPGPPVIIPRPPVPLPPITPPACDVKSMPAKSPWLYRVKCPGEPARLVPRP